MLLEDIGSVFIETVPMSPKNVRFHGKNNAKITILAGVSKSYYKLVWAPIKDSDQPAHPHILIRVFDGCSMGSQGSSVSLGGKLRL